MSRSSHSKLLLAGAAVLGIAGLAPSASAVVAVANSSDFQVVESCVLANGCSGNFTVVNNSSGDGDWYIDGFTVGNPIVFSDATTQTNWNATLGCFSGSCIANNDFDYENNAGSSNVAGDLANDVGPGETSDLFTFSSQFAASPVNLNLLNADGVQTIVSITATDTIPEPASLAVLGTGLLLGLFYLRRRQQSR